MLGEYFLEYRPMYPVCWTVLFKFSCSSNLTWGFYKAFHLIVFGLSVSNFVRDVPVISCNSTKLWFRRNFCFVCWLPAEWCLVQRDRRGCQHGYRRRWSSQHNEDGVAVDRGSARLLTAAQVQPPVSAAAPSSSAEERPAVLHFNLSVYA